MSKQLKPWGTFLIPTVTHLFNKILLISTFTGINIMPKEGFLNLSAYSYLESLSGLKNLSQPVFVSLLSRWLGVYCVLKMPPFREINQWILLEFISV